VTRQLGKADSSLDPTADVKRHGTYDFALDLQALAESWQSSGCLQ